jgi:hypothetical protein
MRKKRFNKSNSVKILTESRSIRISEEVNGQMFFEIGSEITTDISEAVAIMMRFDVDDFIWDKKISFSFDEVDPKKAIYWLSGGDNEWLTLKNYKKSWSECLFEYQVEFGIIVISILNRSKTLRDVRDGYMKYLNLPILYEFALSQEYIK